MIELAQKFSWLIVVLPVLSFVWIAFTMMISGKSQQLARMAAPWILITCLSAALVIAVGSLVGTMQRGERVAATTQHGEAQHGDEAVVEAFTPQDFAEATQVKSPWYETTHPWLAPEPAQTLLPSWTNPGNIITPIDRTLKVGVLLDPLSATMLVVVVLVSLLVQIYSFGYMKREEHPRFYLYMSLFTASMLGLVISSTLLQLFIFWELVGLCSYLLIGFWYQKPEAARAAIKAFVVTRFGDLGLLIAVIALWLSFGDLTFSSLAVAVHQPGLAPVLPLGVIALLLFFGACGKSAQFPLHVWLPDAMEGPTSVSALIHAATMVAAGVFLVARMFFLFEAAPDALVVVAVIGAFTALLAGSIGMAQTDMKKVMAYSTISQLGYMMMGLGLAAPAAAFFHLTTHAFFKALLFLTAGSVIHACHTQNMWEMGGLFKKMKVTAITCLIGGLALAGIAPLAGFFSKDKLLEAAWNVAMQTEHMPAAAASMSPGIAWLVLLMALATVLMTAFYTTRMWALVFLGKPRSAGAEHAHEAPGSMQFSLLVLAALTLVAGFLLVPHLSAMQWGAHNGFELSPVGIIGLVLAVGGILWSAHIYAKRTPQTEPLKALGWVYAGMVNLWWIDAFYKWLAGRVVLVIAGVAARFDKGIIDGGLVDGTAWLTGRLGHRLRVMSAGPLPGQLQYYAVVIFVLAALIILGYSAREIFAVAQLTGGVAR